MSFFEFWKKTKERREVLQESRERELSPSDLKRLLGDSSVRESLGNSSVASLLPPVGLEVFRRFTAASQEESGRHYEAAEETKKRQSDQPANQLRDGKPLPFFYGKPPPELLNIPLEELDPYYQSQQTFLVLGRGNTIHRFNSGSSCFLFSPLHPLRTWAIRVLLHSLFRFFMIITILTNCVFMTMKDPPAWSFNMELLFFIIYSLEVIIKTMSRGCCGKFSFLRDPWNWLDVLVISTVCVSEFVDWNMLLAVSCVARILKLLPLIPGMKSTVTAVFQSAKRLAGVTVMTMFFLSIFALIGQQIFMGNLKHRCFVWPINLTDVYLSNGTSGFDYHEYLQNETNQYFLPSSPNYLQGPRDSLVCGNSSDAGICPEGFTCLKGHRNPNFGYASFDWFGPSLASVVRLMLHDFWEDLVMLTLRASGKTYLAVYVLFFFPGCFGLLCLVIAAVARAIGEQEKAAVAEAKLRNREYSQIQEAFKSSNRDEAACRAALSGEEDQQKASESQHSRAEGSEDSSCPPCCQAVLDVCLKWNCCGCWRWLKQRLLSFVMNPLFDLGIVLCLIINILFLAMEHYPMTESFESMLAVSNLVFMFIYLVELLLKVLAMDPYGYFKVSWNIFDSSIVVFSVLEMGLADVSGLGILRGLRLLRVFRLARWWPSFNLFLKLVWTSLGALRNLTLVLAIVVFLFSVLGTQLFQDDYRDCVCRISRDCELPRWHMNDFFHSFLLVIRILGGEWIEGMWDCMEVSSKSMCVTFFITLVITGKLLVLGLFLTLLLSWVCSALNLSEQTQKTNLELSVIQISRTFWGLLGRKKLDLPAADGKDADGTDGLALDVVTSDQASSAVQALRGETSQQLDIESLSTPVAEIEEELKAPENEEIKGDDEQKHPEVHTVQHAEDHEKNTPEDCCCAGCYRCCPLLDLNKSQSLGRVWANFRRTCLSIVQHQSFEAFIILVIVLSSAALVFEDIHLPQRPVLKVVVETADRVFTFVFLLEMLLKWSSMGLKKYFSDPWCWIDFLILNVSLACLTADLLGPPELGAFICSLRALMPLRIISRVQGLRVVVQTVCRSLPSLVDVILVVLTVWLVFSILGVNLFAGTFFHCLNETAEEDFTHEDLNNKSECLALITANFTEVRWKNLHLTFDNVVSGYQSLFVMAASANWYVIMYAMSDARKIEDQPVYEINMYANLYRVFFTIAVFFTVNFIIRAILSSLQRDWSEGKLLFMTRDQLISIKALKTRLTRTPQFPVPQNSCRVWLRKLVTSLWFEVFIVVVICLYMVALMVEDDQQSVQMDFILYWVHFTFIIIFLIEFILKIAALGRHYFSSGWNVLDFLVLLMLIVGLFLSDLLEKYFVSPSFLPILRLPRLFKVIHLVPRSKGNRKLLSGLFNSLPAIFNIGLLISVLTFSFSVFGMFNFPHVRREVAINDISNFETFWSSLLVLILSTPSSSWYGYLLPIQNRIPDCDPLAENPGLTVQGDCGNPLVGVIFFHTFMVLFCLLLVYLYIAVILEVFNLEDPEQLSERDLTMFYNTWRKFDPDATRCIPYSELSDFCSALKGPLKIPKPNSIRLIHMDLPLLPGDKIQCEDVLLALTSQVFGDSAEVDSLKTRLDKKFTSSSPKVSCEPVSSTLQRKQEEVAAAKIQKAFRKRLQPQGEGLEGAGQSAVGADGGSGV
ncbi:sodium channel protein type 4 subunit alpha B-like [Halichoeres trimaculatus]|uniref:sodium channel protein type 4 subunit alpha B-like n=1 Tax=Halichoeres trimaculatus TaxID=147232 RepID=UPI003D9E5B57